MSVVQFPEAMNSSAADVQIWNNAAFDNGEISEDLTGSRQSWGSLKSIFGNPKASFDSVSDKENRNLATENQIPSVSSSLKSSTTTPFKPVNTDGLIEKSRIKKGFGENVILKLEGGKKIRDEKKIDEEIEEIESEICRLSSRLEALRVEKLERSVKVVEKRGRVVQAKFMEQKQTAKNEEIPIPCLSARTKVQRRGISLGPAEILSVGRRGMSMGPTEIFGAAKASSSTRQLGNQESMMIKTTPLQSRRKSCFFKLQEIDEEKAVSKGRCSLSPKSRKTAAKTQFASRQAVTTISSRKNLKKEDAVISSIQPKKLFKEGEKSTVKKPLIRPGRVVASRYNQSTITTNANAQASAMRKRSLPENDMDQSKRDEKKRSLSSGDDANEKKNLGSESRVKKRWEINPSEIVVHGSSSVVEADLPEFLPRIRIGRCANESPRDSGPAKKVVELIGRKSFFGSDEEVDTSVCQALSFYAEDEEEEEELV